MKLARELSGSFGKPPALLAQGLSSPPARSQLHHAEDSSAPFTRSVLDRAHNAFVAMDETGRVVYWNPQAERTFGYSRKEALGSRLSELIIPARFREAHEQGLRRFLITGEGRVLDERMELVALNRAGVEFPVEVTLWADPTLDRRRFCAFLHDISARKRAEAELERVTAQALAASRGKSEFVARMSHEIRNPLNGVIGMIELLRDTQLDPLQGQYVEALSTSAEAVLSVIGEILDLSKIEAGGLELDRADFELSAVVGDAVKMLAGQARAKGIGLRHELEPDLLSVVHGDAVRLRQVLLNLISNAIKFTDSGAVQLKVRRHCDDLVHFAVSDSGVGISASEASRLFEPFVQAQNATTSKHAGTGLGLAICSQLVALMGGEIGAQPRAGGGSMFWFTARLPERASLS